MARNELLQNLNSAWGESYKMKVNADGVFFSDNDYNILKSSKMFAFKKVPTTFTGNMSEARFVTIQLNMGISKIEDVEDYNSPKENWKNTFDKNIESKDSLEYLNLPFYYTYAWEYYEEEMKKLSADGLTESEAKCYYDCYIQELVCIHKKWNEDVINSINQKDIQATNRDYLIREIFLPILNLRFPFSSKLNIEPIRLLFDPYYITRSKNSTKPIWRCAVKYDPKNCVDWYKYINVGAAASKSDSKSDRKKLCYYKGDQIPALNCNAIYASNLALLQIFPYCSKNSASLRTKKMEQIRYRGIEFVIKFLNEVYEYNKSCEVDKEIYVYLTRPSIINDYLNNSGSKSNVCLKIKETISKEDKKDLNWIFTCRSKGNVVHTANNTIAFELSK